MGELNGSRILVVDDDLPSLDLLCRALEAEGCTVLVATSGERALRVAARSRPDLVLLDVGLGGIDGLETCRRLRAQDATGAPPVILMSADYHRTPRDAALRAGAADYVPKRAPWEEIVLRARGRLARARR